MFVIGMVSKSLAFVPVALVALLFPIGIAIASIAIAEKRSDIRLRSPQCYVYPLLWFIAVLAIAGTYIIGADYYGPPFGLYLGVGILIAVLSLIPLVIALTGPSSKRRRQ